MPFSRVALLYGPAALDRLAAAHVCIAGLGAVGATIAESLARTGVGRFTLIDFDEIRPSNLNRHPFAFRSTLRQPKTAAAARFLADINPAARIEPVSAFLDASTIPPLLAANPGAVWVDAIDALGPKVELLARAHAARPPYLISCLGAARRDDPASFAVADLFQTAGCPLARHVRKWLRRRGVTSGIPCVYSTSLPLPPPPGAPPADEPDFLVRGRHRPPMGSLHAATAAAALLAVREILRHLLAP
jgi:tRNA A37 threonylcarbamoyladenosine dehydratase